MFESLISRIATEINNINNNQIEENNKTHSTEILKHSENYSKLLTLYVDSTKQNIKMKKRFKNVFFFITTGSLVAIVFLFIITLLYAFKSFNKFENLNGVTIEAVLSIITIVIPAISSLIVAFIKLPEIIAHYLFNAEEDNNMNLIIKNIQDYDKAMFEMEQKLNDLLINNKDQSSEVEDDDIEESPAEAAN